MRNWNKDLYQRKEKDQLSFYSTYEELKLYTLQAVCMSKTGFYSTYEELKLK